MRISLVILLASSCAFAEPGPKKPQKGHNGFAAGVLQELDSNGDQKLSREEFEANPRLKRATQKQKNSLFERIDKDGNGTLEFSEISEPPNPFQHQRNRGPVNFEEFKQKPRISKLPAEMQKRLFSRMDKNADGIIDRNDLKGRSPDRRPSNPPVQIDENKDGLISFDEFRKTPHISRMNEDEAEDAFEKLDKNGDLVLDESERPKRGRQGPHPERRNPERTGKPNKNKSAQ